MKKASVACAVVLLSVIMIKVAHANSYLVMLTEPPEGYEKSTLVDSAVEVMPQHNTLD